MISDELGGFMSSAEAFLEGSERRLPATIETCQKLKTMGHLANSVVISYNGFTHLLNGYSQDINQFIVVKQGSNNLRFFQKHKSRRSQIG